MTDQKRPADVYPWSKAVGFAVFATAAAVGLIVVFTYLVDWVGDFWAQVVYFSAVFGGICAAAVRSRRKDEADPARLVGGANPITPAGLPGPVVITQALGVLGVAMLVAGSLIGGERGLLWHFSGFVLVLVGGVGLAFWLAGLRGRRRTF